MLGCSEAPFNPLRQVLNAVGVTEEEVDWIRYDGWGMVVPPGECSKEDAAKAAATVGAATGTTDGSDSNGSGGGSDGGGSEAAAAAAQEQAQEGRWRLSLGPGKFEDGPLEAFGGPEALQEFKGLQEATAPLVAAAVDIPVMGLSFCDLSTDLYLPTYLPANDVEVFLLPVFMVQLVSPPIKSLTHRHVFSKIFCSHLL
jgi:hypothetical protein